MKLITTAQSLKNALARFRGVIHRRNTIPILSCVLIDGGTLVGTDLNMEISVDVPSRNEGRAAVDYFHLSQVVSTLPADTEVTIEGEPANNASGQEITLRFDGGCYWLFATSADDFPRIDPPKKPVVFRSGNAGLADAFKRVHHCISTEETRYYLNGACLSQDRCGTPCVVTTDGHRMAIVKLPGASGFDSQIVHRAAVEQVMRAGEPEQVRFDTDRPIIEFRWPGAKLISKLIDGAFPDWPRVVPDIDGAVRLRLNTAEVKSALRRMSFGDERSKHVIFSLFGNTPAITRKQGGHAAVERLTQSAVSSINTNTPQVGLNAVYVAAMLSAQGTEDVEICIPDESSPLLVEGEHLTSILMPLRASLDAKEVRGLLSKARLTEPEAMEAA